jgi:hypothetical protein
MRRLVVGKERVLEALDAVDDALFATALEHLQVPLPQPARSSGGSSNTATGTRNTTRVASRRQQQTCGHARSNTANLSGFGVFGSGGWQ